MPSNRSKNAPKKNSGARGSSSRASKAAQVPERGSVTGDLVGIALAVVAIAMVVSIVAPSSAVITRAVGNGLELAFGAGAILFPLALLAFSATFFVEDGTLVSGRIAAGLTLVVLAVLAMLSLNLPGAESMPESVVSATVVTGAGGYVGGFIALALLRFLGVIVGNVVLVGLVVTGIVICGFSISDAVSRYQLAPRPRRRAPPCPRRGQGPGARACRPGGRHHPRACPQGRPPQGRGPPGLTL